MHPRPYLNPVADASTSHLSWLGPTATVTDTTMITVESDNAERQPIATATGPLNIHFSSFQILVLYPIIYSVAYSAVTMMLTLLAFSVHSPFPFGKNLRLLLADHCFDSAIARAEILAISRGQAFTFPECKSMIFDTKFCS